MITDMGGFAGATFKRGIRNLNIPTSLMASVDAAVGGKTGINFCGLKNEIGSFYEPDCVMIDCSFLTTLDHKNFLSGYAEMLKHGLISKKETFDELMSYDIDKQDVKQLNVLVGKSVAVKERIVAEDPREHGIRKALNFGHTVGHAVESLSFAREEPLLHGLAVAVGIVAELFLSYKVCGFPLDILRLTTNFIIKNYPRFIIGCNDFESLLTLMTHDKKNHGGQINFTLLGNIGDIRINQQVSDALIEEALDFYREN
jgi:3-dehydroquinate synthase